MRKKRKRAYGCKSEARERRNRHFRRFNKFDYSNEPDIGSASIKVASQRKKKRKGKEENAINVDDGDIDNAIDADVDDNNLNEDEDDDIDDNVYDKGNNAINIPKSSVFVRKYLSKTVRKHDTHPRYNPDHRYTSWPWGMPHHSLTGAGGINLYRTCRFVSRIATRLLLSSESEEEQQQANNNNNIHQALNLLHRVPASFNQYYLLSKYVKSEKNNDDTYKEVPIEIKDQYFPKITDLKQHTKHKITNHVNNYLLSKNNHGDGIDGSNDNDNDTSSSYVKKETKQEEIKRKNRELQECANARERNAFATYFKSKEDRKVKFDVNNVQKKKDNENEEEIDHDDVKSKDNDNYEDCDDDYEDDDDLFLTEDEIDKLNFTKEQTKAYEKLTMEDVYHPKGIDPSTIVLTTSYMLTQYLQNSHQKGDDNDDNTNNKGGNNSIGLRDIDEYLRTCMEATSVTKVAANKSTHGPKTNRALILSLIQSLYTFLSPTTINDYDDDGEEEEEIVSSLRCIAADLVNIGNAYRIDETLVRFTNLHVTTTIAQIVLCPYIPPKTIIVLSKPLDLTSLNYRTPFDIFQNMFMHLDKFQSDDELHEFVIGFEKAMDTIQLNLNQLPFECISTSISWYLSILCCIMVASCGIFTLAKKQKNNDYKNVSSSYDDDDDDDEDDEDLCVDLDVFQMYRKRVLHLLQRILNFVSSIQQQQEQQNNTTYSDYYILLSSFFEWKQVLYALYGNHIHKNNDDDNKDIFATISNIHSYYTYQCSLSLGNDDNNNINYKYRIQELINNKCLSIEYYKSYIANQLESHCDDISYWIELVSMLGHIGTKVNNHDSDDDHDDNDDVCNNNKNDYKNCGILHCQQCQLLKSGLIIPHGKIKKLNDNNLWWGSNRQWWYPIFFSLPFSNDDYDDDDATINYHDDKNNNNKRFHQQQYAKKLILKYLLMNDNSTNKLFCFNHEEKKLHDNDSSEQSLDINDSSFTTLNSIDNIHDGIDPDFLFKYSSYSNHFPKHISEVINDVKNKEYNGNFNKRKTYEIPMISSSPSSSHELAYKIIIVCHLYTICHSFVNDGIQYLLDQCCKSLYDDFLIDNDDDIELCNENMIFKFLENDDPFISLCWLQGMGLDVNKIVDFNIKQDI